MTSCMQWYATQNPVITVKYLRDQLKYLQWQAGIEPWVLKSPLWVGLEPFILKVFPDADRVMTHRDRNQTIPSLFRLLDTFHAPFSHKKPEYETLRVGLAMGMEQHLANRKTRPDMRILDIAYPEITGSSDALAAKVYDFCDMTFSDEAAEHIKKWEADNPIHKLGAFQYSQVDYQLTPEIINGDFAGYIEFAKGLF